MSVILLGQQNVLSSCFSYNLCDDPNSWCVPGNLQARLISRVINSPVMALTQMVLFLPCGFPQWILGD